MGRQPIKWRRRSGTRLMVLFLAAVLILGILTIYAIYDQRAAVPENGTTGAPVSTAGTDAPDTAPPETTAPETTGAPVVEDTEVEITGTHAIVADGTTGKILYEKGGADTRIYPASITKLFTAWVALQHLDPQDPCTAGAELDLVAPDSSRAFIYRGQTVTAEMAIQGMLMNSGNDAAYILAAAAGRKIAGSDGIDAAEAVKVFVQEMNDQALALGLADSHFMNPDGYHDDGHYTTMGDLVVIAQLAMSSEIIQAYASMAKADVKYLSGETNSWTNTNLLIQEDSDYYLPEACGLKTGHTSSSGYCLLSAIRRDEGYTIIGVFGTPGYTDRFADTRILADAFLGIDWEPPVQEGTSAQTDTTE